VVVTKVTSAVSDPERARLTTVFKLQRLRDHLIFRDTRNPYRVSWNIRIGRHSRCEGRGTLDTTYVRIVCLVKLR